MKIKNLLNMKIHLLMCFLLTLSQLLGQENDASFEKLFNLALGDFETDKARRQVELWGFKLWSMNSEYVFIPYLAERKTEYLAGFENLVEVAFTTESDLGQITDRDFSRVEYVRIGYSASRYDRRFHSVVGELGREYKPKNQAEMHQLFFSKIESLNERLPVGFDTNVTPHDLGDLVWCAERVNLNSENTGRKSRTRSSGGLSVKVNRLQGPGRANE